MSARQEDFVFAEHVLRRGFATEEQVQESLDLLTRVRVEMELDETLEGILLKRGYLAQAQATVIRQAIDPVEAGRSRNQIEGYRLLARLGSGAMGSVYKARHHKLDIDVALKVLRVELAQSKTQVGRLKREAQLAARLNHINIVRSLDVGESNGFHYFAMEFVDGPTARGLIRDTRMKEKEAIRIVTCVARALEHAHAHGVVHRDVKPANIMLSKDGQVKLGDFGLARGQGPSELTMEHAAIGTPQYLAPEQATAAANAGPRSDLFSLGATLYHLVTGQPPFMGENLAEIFGNVLRANYAPPESVVSDLSVDTIFLIHKLMRPNPRDRYASATDLLVDLEKLQRGQSIAPADFKGDYQAFLDGRRRKRLTIAVAAVALIGISIWYTVSTIRAGQLREETLRTCVALNDLGDGELDRLTTPEQFRSRHAALKAELDGASNCSADTLRGLAARVKLLGTDIVWVEAAVDVRKRAAGKDVNFRALLLEAEAILPELSGALAIRDRAIAAVRDASASQAKARYRLIYNDTVYDDAGEVVAALRKLAGELRETLLPVSEKWAGEVEVHAKELESLTVAYERARRDHGESYRNALRDENFDAAARQLELIRQEWSAAYSRANQQQVPGRFLALYPSEYEGHGDLPRGERAVWVRTQAQAERADKNGRPDLALRIVNEFLSGSKEFRKTAEQEIKRLTRRASEIQDDQQREVKQLDRLFKSALGGRQYAAAVAHVSRTKSKHQWFGDAKRHFATMERRAAAIEKLIVRFLVGVRELDAVPVTKITGESKPKTAPGSAISHVDGDEYQLDIGKRSWKFTLVQIPSKTLKQIFSSDSGQGAGGGVGRVAAGYFHIAEAYRESIPPYEARDHLRAAQKALLSTFDEWADGVGVEVEALDVRIKLGEDRAEQLYGYALEAQKKNKHDDSLLYLDQLVREYAWTLKVQDNRKSIDKMRKAVKRLAGVGSLRKDRFIPRKNFRLLDSGDAEIRYDGATWHPLADKVPSDEADPQSWLDQKEREFFLGRWRGRNEGIKAFDEYFHRARHQLLDWSGRIDVVHPRSGESTLPPSYTLQVKEAGEPDRLWWEEKFDKLDHTVGLLNHFRLDQNWSIEFSVDWVESVWREKVVQRSAKTQNSVVVEETKRGRIPVYFAVACGRIQGALAYFPKRNGGVAGTRVFLDDEMSPKDGHSGRLSDFHWHMANASNRKKISADDRAWLDRWNYREDVSYRVRLARIGNEVHVWMAPEEDWRKRTFTAVPLDQWKKKKGKAAGFPRAVHVWMKTRAPRELDKAANFPDGTPKFRFFGRVRFSLRDVVVTGKLKGDGNKQ